MDKAIKWAKEHKKQFAKKLIDDAGVVSSIEPVAIFTAGLPGAGKTEFTKNLIKILGAKVIRLDMDEIAAQIDSYSPQKADMFRQAASMLLSRTFDLVVNGKYDFVMDGTFAGRSAVKDVNRALRHGYVVKVIMIFQDPRLAWKYTVAREKVEHRSIDFDGFIESFFRIKKNLQELTLIKDANLSLELVTKDEQNRIRDWVNLSSMEYIDSFVNMGYTENSLRNYINESN